MGVAASPVAKWLGVDGDRAGRVAVYECLTVAGHPEIFVLAKDAKGKALPGLAPVAKQQGEYVGKLLTRLRKTPGAKRFAFAYKDYGALATIGRKIAIADFGLFSLRGFVGWLTWSVAHIYFLIGFRNRFSVARLDVELPHLPARGAPDHWPGGRGAEGGKDGRRGGKPQGGLRPAAGLRTPYVQVHGIDHLPGFRYLWGTGGAAPQACGGGSSTLACA